MQIYNSVCDILEIKVDKGTNIHIFCMEIASLHHYIAEDVKNMKISSYLSLHSVKIFIYCCYSSLLDFRNKYFLEHIILNTLKVIVKIIFLMTVL